MKKVRESWDLRKKLYEENWEIQLLRRELEQAEAWLAAKESFVSDPSYGVSRNSVTLLKYLSAYADNLEYAPSQTALPLCLLRDSVLI